MNIKEIAKHRDYSDIIDHPHHESTTRPHMSMHNRAAQFSPFAALVGYDAAVEEAERITDSQITLDEDAVTMLDEILSELISRESEHPEITVFYFIKDEKKAGGAYVEKTGQFKKADQYKRTIVFTDGSEIPVGDVVDIVLKE